LKYNSFGPELANKLAEPATVSKIGKVQKEGSRSRNKIIFTTDLKEQCDGKDFSVSTKVITHFNLFGSVCVLC
jgi:hypothetical protein